MVLGSRAIFGGVVRPVRGGDEAGIEVCGGGMNGHEYHENWAKMAL